MPLRRSPAACAMALASVFGSGGSAVGTDDTGCGATPAAHGFGLTATTPAERLALVPVVPHVGVTWPVTSTPSAQIALVEPELDPAVQVPPAPTQLCASV